MLSRKAKHLLTGFCFHSVGSASPVRGFHGWPSGFHYVHCRQRQRLRRPARPLDCFPGVLLFFPTGKMGAFATKAKLLSKRQLASGTPYTPGVIEKVLSC